MAAFVLQIKYEDVSREYEFNRLPPQCPYCHLSIKPLAKSAHVVNDEEVNIFFHCPNDDCSKGFMGMYYGSNRFYDLEEVTFGKPFIREFDDAISALSPQFVKIYNQASFAEQHNLLEICGVGYRKSLEFLIKDYANAKHTDKEVEIEKQPLAACINNYVSDDRVKSVAKRAVWLGNDETHYVRKWQGKNLEDLKKLIELTLHWIEMEVLTQSFEDDMPDSK